MSRMMALSWKSLGVKTAATPKFLSLAASSGGMMPPTTRGTSSNPSSRMRKEGLDDVPVVVGGIIPPEDAATLKALGVAAVYTPKNFQLNAIMGDIVRLAAGLDEAA